MWSVHARPVQCAEGLAWLSETHAHPPGVVCEDFLFFLHDAGVCAFVDGVGHYSYVVIFQRDVVGVGVLQQLAVLVPAETNRSVLILTTYIDIQL